MTSVLPRALELIADCASEDQLLDQLAELLQAAAGSDGCDLFIRESGDTLVLRASTQSPEFNSRCRLGRGVGLCGQAFISGEPIYLEEDANRHPSNVAYPGIDDLAYQSMAILPLSTSAGPLGALIFFRQTAWRFVPDTREHLFQLSREACQAIAAYRNAFRHGCNSETLGAVREVSRTIASSPYLEEVLQLLVNLTAQQFNYAVCTVRLLDERRGELVLRATQAPVKAYQRKPAIRIGESIAGRALQENRAIVVPDVQHEPDYIGHDLAAEQGLRSMICLPLTLFDRPVGVMSCYTTEVRDFSPHEISALETIAKQAAYTIEHARLQVRSTLMQEMHHRVKNNLQQVASLLRLQLRHGEGKSLEDALHDSLTRILAISAVHDLLSRENLDLVDMRSLAESLVQLQRDSLMLPDRRIGFQIQGDEVHLNTTQGTQVALILNELIQNAIDHGFRAVHEGEIHVTIEDRSGEIGLWVSNNGEVLPPDFDPLASSHLGLKIVDNLAKGLGGVFRMSEHLGWTVAEVKFLRASGE